MLFCFAIILMFLNFIIVYNDIDLDLLNNHSKSYIKKIKKGFVKKVFFTPFIREINVLKYSFLVFNYFISLMGLIIQFITTLNLISEDSIFVAFVFKTIVICSLSLFLYKTLINRIMIIMQEHKSSVICIICVLVLIYIIFVVIVPVYKKMFL